VKKVAFSILIVSFCIALFPVVAMPLSKFLTLVFGCHLNAEDLSSCPTIFGDLGGHLYNMSTLGSFLFYTIPVGFGGLILGAILLAWIHARSTKTHSK
jgi:hypothetical protein